MGNDNGRDERFRFPEMTTETRTLEAMRYVAQAQLSPQMAHDLTVELIPRVTGEMLVRLKTDVYAEKVTHDDQHVPFEKSCAGRTTAVHTVTAPEKTAGFVVIGCVLLWLGIVLSIVLGGMGCAIGGATLMVIFACVGLLQTENQIVDADYEATVSGTVTVRAKYWQKFPDNARVFPKEYGQPVKFITYDEPTVRFDR